MNEIDSNATIFFVHPEPVKKKRKRRGRNNATAEGDVKDEADDPNLVDPEDDANEVEEGDDPDNEVINAPDPASVPRAVLNAREVLINTAELAAAATLTARHSINADEISDLGDLLRSFGAGQAALYGPKWVVYNTHIATHVPEHIKRFGPAWHFSAYHFERMNGQLSNTGTNRHRNGEIESSYTNAFCTRGRFEMFLSRNESLAETASLTERIPPIKLDIPSRSDSRSVLGREGNVSVVMSVGKPYDIPSRLYAHLLDHIRRTNPTALPSWSTRSDGTKVIKRMQRHDSLKFGHVLLGGFGSRVNANVSRTFCVVEADGGTLDLFQIANILSHDFRAASGTETRVYLLGRRASKVSLPAFDEAMSDPRLQRYLKYFLTDANQWGEEELLPVSRLTSNRHT
ncbi:unnamed protein product [Tilletia laevis]|uniref:Uncharacterized protein n=1 Tax=Tilletia laevis TaxID=157183 RepID=A0A9N8M0N6_9BASI|nr:unnamed protein product [Tilletia laevis]